MSYRSGTMVNPGEGSAWQAGAWVTTDPARIHTPEFLDEATFEAEVEAGGIEEDSSPLLDVVVDSSKFKAGSRAIAESTKPPAIAELRVLYRKRTGEDPAGLKKAELLEALDALGALDAGGEDDADASD